MKTKFTKSGWHFRTGMSDNFCEIIGDFGTNKVIAVAPKDCFVNKEEAEANGRLIAAAPDLLDACIWAKEQFKILADKGLYPEHLLAEKGGDGMMPLVNAIKKATE